MNSKYLSVKLSSIMVLMALVIFFSGTFSMAKDRNFTKDTSVHPKMVNFDVALKTLKQNKKVPKSLPGSLGKNHNFCFAHNKCLCD